MVSLEANIPGWVGAILGEKFFNSCLVHESEKKNEENCFCLDCCIALCLHCLPSHTTHCLLQIRRYVYRDVLRLKDAESLMDCTSIQPYTSNGAKVLFLRQRSPQMMMMMMASTSPNCNCCLVCHKTLQDPYLFCSISCKVNCNVIKSNKYESATSSGSSSSTGRTNCRIHGSINQSFKKKKRRSCKSVVSESPSECSSAATNRRKNVPRRSPLS